MNKKIMEQLDQLELTLSKATDNFDRLYKILKKANKENERLLNIILLFHDMTRRAKKKGIYITDFLNIEERETLQALLEDNRVDI